MRLRLATRLALSHVLVVLLGLGLAGIGLVSQTRRYFVSADREALQVQARFAADTCNDLCLKQGRGSVKVTADQLPAANNVIQSQANNPTNLAVNEESQQVSARLPSTVKVYGRGVKVSGVPDVDRLVTRAFEGSEATSVNGSALLAVAPIRRNGDVVGGVVVRGTLRNVNAVLRDLQKQLLGALALGSLAALAFGVWRARSIAKPLRELTVATRGVSEGRFNQSLPTNRRTDELAELTQTFDHMRNRVQDELAIRNAFVADASHELRTPLTAIRGSVEILQNGGMERPEVRERFLGSLGRETDRLLELVDRLLDLQTHNQTPKHESVDLQNLAESVAVDLGVIAVRAGVALEAVRGDPVVVLGDESRLRQVVVNLVQNAMNAAPPDTTIFIRTHTTDRYALLEVEDRGLGIPEADRERVFERFVRLDTSRARTQNNSQNAAQSSGQDVGHIASRSAGQNMIQNAAQSVAQHAGGAGLGLPIARLIAETHGGTLTLHGASPHGTIARLQLPLP